MRSARAGDGQKSGKRRKSNEWKRPALLRQAACSLQANVQAQQPMTSIPNFRPCRGRWDPGPAYRTSLAPGGICGELGQSRRLEETPTPVVEAPEEKTETQLGLCFEENEAVGLPSGGS
jgi:hypothetical protein